MLNRFLGLAVAICFTAVCMATTAYGQSDAERLEKLERAVEQLQKRNAQLEQEILSLKKERTSAPPSTPRLPAKATADSKAVVHEPVEKEKARKPVFAIAAGSEFKLTLGGFIQAQVEAGDVFAFEGRFSEGTGEIKDRFRIRRGRISLTGDYTEHFDFKAEGDFSLSDTALTVRDSEGRTVASNSTRTSFSATDIFANWHTYPEFNVKVGQYKAPFGLEQITADTKLFTNERSLVTTALTPDRQIGVQLWGKPFTNLWPDQKDLVTYFAGIFNGTGRNISVNDNNEFMYVGRLEVMALQSKILNQDVSLKFGANGLTSRDETGNTISSVLNENSDGSLSAFTLPSPGKHEAYGFDVSLHFGPFDLVAEYLNERITARSAAGITPLFSSFEADGGYVQVSYFVVPKTLQLVTKWELFNPDQRANDDIESITAGLNYYLKGDDIKILANYIHTWSDFRASNPEFGKAEFDEVIVRLQVIF